MPDGTQPIENEPKSKNSIAERLTPKLAEHFVPIPSYFLANYHRIVPHGGARGLSSTEVVLIVQILDFKWTREAPFPSVMSLAARMGMSDRAVREALKTLEELGLLRREARTGIGGGRSSNRYHLDGLFNRLEQMMADDEAAKAKAAAPAAAPSNTASTVNSANTMMTAAVPAPLPTQPMVFPPFTPPPLPVTSVFNTLHQVASTPASTQAGIMASLVTAAVTQPKPLNSIVDAALALGGPVRRG